jgi:hypothetical protein
MPRRLPPPKTPEPLPPREALRLEILGHARTLVRRLETPLGSCEMPWYEASITSLDRRLAAGDVFGIHDAVSEFVCEAGEWQERFCEAVGMPAAAAERMADTRAAGTAKGTLRGPTAKTRERAAAMALAADDPDAAWLGDDD